MYFSLLEENKNNDASAFIKGTKSSNLVFIEFPKFSTEMFLLFFKAISV